MPTRQHEQSGFTIVELLIVVVVIGILAAITIVAYNGISQRGRDSARSSDTAAIKKAIELYNVDNGKYPTVGSTDTGYDSSILASTLVPTYISKLPTDPKTGNFNYQYVYGPAANNSYAVLVSYETKSACKIGSNINSIWWAAPNC